DWIPIYHSLPFPHSASTTVTLQRQPPSTTGTSPFSVSSKNQNHTAAEKNFLVCLFVRVEHPPFLLHSLRRTRAGYSRADQFYASYPAGTELLTDTSKLYKAALGNVFEAEEWGPIEFCIMEKHFERQGKSPYAYHSLNQFIDLVKPKHNTYDHAPYHFVGVSEVFMEQSIKHKNTWRTSFLWDKLMEVVEGIAQQVNLQYMMLRKAK
ncbi:hypothetical protein Lal_00020695, partial [Lupinus albus]